MKFNGIEITEESISACRQWFADNLQAQIDEVSAGVVKLPAHVVFDEYQANKMQNKEAAMSGEYDHTFTFMQRAYYIQTGESVALLP